MALNLILAVFWLVVGSVLFLWPVLLPETPPLFDPPMDTRIGAFAVILFVYNLGRWYFAARRARLQREARPPVRTRSRRGDEEPPNPDFDFSGDRSPPS